MPAIFDTTRASIPIRAGRLFFKYRDLLFPLVFLPLALTTRPSGLVWQLDASMVALIVGLAMVIAGQGLRALVIGLVYIRRGGRDKQIHADDLVTGGIFAHSRNPLYLGNLGIAMGLTAMHGGTWMLAVVPPFFLAVYASIVVAEEAYLRERFGAAYSLYSAEVPRFLPRMRGLGATVRSLRFDWTRLLNKEYGTFFSTATAVLLVLAWKRVTTVGFDEARPFVVALASVWLTSLGGYVVARVLKKRRLLEPSSSTPHSRASS